MVVDELIVTLGLDPKAFTKGQKDALAAFKRTKDEAAAAAKDMEASGVKGASFFGNIKKEALGLFAALVGANGIKDFIVSSTRANVSLGQMAHNLNIDGHALAKWEGAVRKAGGAAGDATTGLQSITDLYQGWMKGELDSTKSNALSRLGINGNDLKDSEAGLLKIGEALMRLNKINPATAANTARDLGMPTGMLPFLEKGTSDMQKYLDEQDRFFAVTDEDIAAAKKLREGWVGMSEAVSNLATHIQTEATPAMVKFEGWIQKGIENNPEFASGIMKIGAALTALTTIGLGTGLLAKLFGKAAPAATATATAAVTGAELTASSAIAATTVVTGGSLGFLAALPGILGVGGGGVQIITKEERERHKNQADKRGDAKKAYDWLRDKVSGFNTSEMNKADITAFMGMGWTKEQAEGIEARIQKESRGDIHSRVDNKTEHAYGLMSWHRDRQAMFKAHTGLDIKDPQVTRAMQLEFIDWELRNNEKRAGGLLSKAVDAGSAGAIVSKYYARPGAISQNAAGTSALAMRYDASLALGSPVQPMVDRSSGDTHNTTTNTTEVVMNNTQIITKSDDPEGIASGLAGYLKRNMLVGAAAMGQR